MANYKIDSAGGEPDGAFLVGCEIIKIASNSWQLKEGSKVLASATGANPAFKFNNFHKWNWEVRASTVTASKMGGSWSNNNPNKVGGEDESDSWTASGTGKHGIQGKEARYASAK
jgi:hypothetical protein